MTAYSKVPVLAVSTADDSKPSVLVDSRAICDIIEEELPSNVLAKDHHTSPNTSATATASESNDISYAKTPLNEDDWRRWTRDVLVRVMVVNMNRSFGDAWASFSYVDTMDLTPGRKVRELLFLHHNAYLLFCYEAIYETFGGADDVHCIEDDDGEAPSQVGI